MRSKTNRKKYVKAADNAMRDYILKKYPKCVICNSTENLQAGHLITSKNYSTRWDEDNVFTQCRSCNLLHEYHPETFTLWYIKKFGLSQYELLVYRSKRGMKFTNNDLVLIAEHYKNKLKELEG